MTTKENVTTLKDRAKKLEKSDFTAEAIDLLKLIVDKVKSKGETVVEDLEDTGEEGLEYASDLQDHVVNYVKNNPLKVIGLTGLAVAAVALLFHEYH